jgi:hypothetical protein
MRPLVARLTRPPRRRQTCSYSQEPRRGARVRPARRSA